MKTLYTLIALIGISFASNGQNILQKIHQRNLQHEKRVQEAQAMGKITEDIQLKAKNPGTTLRQGGDLLIGGLLVQTVSAGVGTLMLNSDKPIDAGKYVIIGGAAIGLGLQIAGFSKIIKAGKQFEVRIGN